MRTSIRMLGNAGVVSLPTRLLIQTGIKDEAEVTVENGAIVLRKPATAVRAGWAEASRRIAAAGDDVLVWPEFANKGD